MLVVLCVQSKVGHLPDRSGLGDQALAAVYLLLVWASWSTPTSYIPSSYAILQIPQKLGMHIRFVMQQLHVVAKKINMAAAVASERPTTCRNILQHC